MVSRRRPHPHSATTACTPRSHPRSRASDRNRDEATQLHRCREVAVRVGEPGLFFEGSIRSCSRSRSTRTKRSSRRREVAARDRHGLSARVGTGRIEAHARARWNRCPRIECDRCGHGRLITEVEERHDALVLGAVNGRPLSSSDDFARQDRVGTDRSVGGDNGRRDGVEANGSAPAGHCITSTSSRRPMLAVHETRA